MFSVCAVRLVMLFSLMAASAATAAPTTLGTLRFDAPDAADGWTQKPIKNGLLLQKEYPPDQNRRRKGGAIIQIFGPFAGGPAGLEKGVATMARGIDGLAEEKPYATSQGVTTNGHSIRSERRCCARMKGLSVGQWTVGIASDHAQVVLALVGLELKDGAQDSAEATFEALVRSVRLDADDRPFELVPRPDDGGLDGVYTHLSSGIRPNAFGGTDFYSESEITVFDPSGLFATQLPTDGDVASHCRTEPTDCGLYALKGGGLLGGRSEIEMRSVANAFGAIETETKPFAKTKDGLEIDEGAYVAVPPVAAGTPFEGTWRYFFGSSGSTAFTSNSVAVERILTLSRNGTFQRNGWSGASGSTDTGTGTTGFATKGGNRPATNGRYRIEGYVLELVAEDGRTERLSIFAPDKGSDKLLVIGGSNYLKAE